MIQYDTLRDAHRAGLIAWDSIAAYHTRDYPLCACGTPTALTVDGIEPICHTCLTEQLDTIMERVHAELSARGLR